MNIKLRVLLVEDSRFFLSIEGQFLHKTPVEVIEADSCEMALSIIRKEKPDLVYMAFSLPGEGGAKCCQTIKRDPEISSVPVVLICDQGKPEQPKIAQQNGCDAFLVKPLDRQSFLQVGRQFLKGIREYRHSSFFPVIVSFDGEEHQGKCLDVSSGGLFVESQAEIPDGSMVNLSFKLPDTLSTHMICGAKVMWKNRRPNALKPHYPHGLGIMFVDLPASSRKAILRLSEKKPNS